MKRIFFIVYSMLSILLFGCGRHFLDEKPDKALLVPTTLNDFQAMLDNTTIINVAPALNIIAGDEYVITTNGSALNALQRNTYFWADDVYEATAIISDWSTPYKQVFYANIVLDGLQKVERLNDSINYDRIKGSALFVRAHAFYNLAQSFATPYKSSKASILPGIPIHLTSNVNIRLKRGTLQETYDQIVKDLKEAETLLPINVPFKSRPSRGAALALLARTYLTMQDYENASAYAGLSLTLNSRLMDYNSLSKIATNPFPIILPNGNDEVLYYNMNVSYAFFTSILVKVTDEIKNLYDQDDLRKILFFLPSNGRFRGYIGIANDEVLLIRAESNCRLNRLDLANEDLNRLLLNRYTSGTYDSVIISNQKDLLTRILKERRKELVGRGLRWSDLRRLNQDPNEAITLKRIRDGVEIVLLPNADKYTFPIPNSDLGNGVDQNKR